MLFQPRSGSWVAFRLQDDKSPRVLVSLLRNSLQLAANYNPVKVTERRVCSACSIRGGTGDWSFVLLRHELILC